MVFQVMAADVSKHPQVYGSTLLIGCSDWPISKILNADQIYSSDSLKWAFYLMPIYILIPNIRYCRKHPLLQLQSRVISRRQKMPLEGAKQIPSSPRKINMLYSSLTPLEQILRGVLLKGTSDRLVATKLYRNVAYGWSPGLFNCPRSRKNP